MPINNRCQQQTKCLTTLFPFPVPTVRLQVPNTKVTNTSYTWAAGRADQWFIVLEEKGRSSEMLAALRKRNIIKASVRHVQDFSCHVQTFLVLCNTQYKSTCYANVCKIYGNVLCINKHPPPRKQPFTGCLLGRVKWFSTEKYEPVTDFHQSLASTWEFRMGIDLSSLTPLLTVETTKPSSWFWFSSDDAVAARSGGFNWLCWSWSCLADP